MKVTKYISWLQCHEKVKFCDKGMLKPNPVLMFITKLQQDMAQILASENKTLALEIVSEKLDAIENEWFETAEEADMYRDKIGAQVVRLVSFFFDKGYRSEERYPHRIPWTVSDIQLSDKDEDITGAIDMAAINPEGQREYITFDFFHTHGYSAKARIETNKPCCHPMNCFAAYAIKDMSATYSVWYLNGKDDRNGKYPAFEEKAGANIVSSDFGGDLTFVATAIAALSCKEEKRECRSCIYSAICKGYAGIVEPSDDDVVKNLNGTAKACENTSEQDAVINFKNGALCVIAVPGSGKTYTLVKRMEKMISDGICPENILFLTFAKKACGEIRMRVARALGKAPEETDMPHIQTLNGFGYEILRANQNLLDRKVKLASPSLRKELIAGVILSEKPIDGVSYINIRGPYGLVNKVDGYFKVIQENGEEYFRDEYGSKCDVNGVLRLYEHFIEVFKSAGYISYDEQVLMAVQLLKEHPELVAKYNKLYRYVMVDEFQDINEMQKDLLGLVASHGNIVAVGDDDQAIYEFRGGSSKYMLNFAEYFPNAKELHLSENFRSNDKIVLTAASVIEHNQQRIGKDIVASRKAGAKPLLLDAPSSDSLYSYIRELKKGYGGKNIAIIARTNNELLAWQEYLRAHGEACTSPKDYLVGDRVFQTLYDVLSIYYLGADKAGESFARIFEHFCGSEYSQKEASFGESFYNVLLREKILSSLDNTIEAKKNSYGINSVVESFVGSIFRSYLAFDYCDDIGRMLYQFLEIWYPNDIDKPNYHVAIDILIDNCDEGQIDSVKGLWNSMYLLVEYNDDTRVGYDYGSDAINLMTAHDSKGKEFDAVVVLSTDSFVKTGTEDERRVLYVALTRARHTLVMTTSGTETNSRIYDEISGSSVTCA